jgi:hypothetical protein
VCCMRLVSQGIPRGIGVEDIAFLRTQHAKGAHGCAPCRFLVSEWS